MGCLLCMSMGRLEWEEWQGPDWKEPCWSRLQGYAIIAKQQEHIDYASTLDKLGPCWGIL